METRQNNRLSEYDYGSIGAYFITVCVKDKQKILSHIVGDGALDVPNIQLTNIGEIVDKYIQSTNKIENITVDKYVIMPNHIHLLISIQEIDGRIISAPTISTVVGQMKRQISKLIGTGIWQKSFYDHIIRNRHDYDAAWQYIDENPIKWTSDEFYN